jgi:hypothetical protein
VIVAPPPGLGRAHQVALHISPNKHLRLRQLTTPKHLILLQLLPHHPGLLQITLSGLNVQFGLRRC